MDYREKIVHGDEGLPVAIYEIAPGHIRYRMNVHWHPEHEILHVRRGHIHVRLNDLSFELKTGDVIFIPGGTIHSAEPDGCDYTCILINLSLLMKKSDACMETVDRIRDGELRIDTRLGSGMNSYAALCDRMLEVYRQKSEAYPFLIKGLIFTFFGNILSDGRYTRTDGGKASGETVSGRLKIAIAHIEQHYDSVIRLNTLAELADMTPNHFCRSFKAVTGLTPFEYIIRCRLTKAQHALRATDMTVTEIALDCGFNDVSHFIRVFRETYGITPKKFRQTEETEG